MEGIRGFEVAARFQVQLSELKPCVGGAGSAGTRGLLVDFRLQLWGDARASIELQIFTGRTQCKAHGQRHAETAPRTAVAMGR